MRNSLFGFVDDQDTPTLHFWPEPGTTEYASPQRVGIELPTRFRDWTILYTLDPEIGLDRTDEWITYSPEKGLMLGATVDIRAIAYLEGTAEVTSVSAARYVFNMPNIQVYVDPSGPSDGTGIDPAMPFNTLQAGIDLAAGIYSGGAPVIVCARAGMYGETVEMKPGVILRGSYNADWVSPGDATTVDAGFYPSSELRGTLDNELIVPPPDGEDSTPLHSLRFPAGMASPTAVEHFIVRAPAGGTYSSAILVESQFARVHQCRVEGGEGSTVATAIWNRNNGGVIVDDSFVRGRSQNNPGWAIGVINRGSILELRGSMIASGLEGGGAQQHIGIASRSGLFGVSSLTVADGSSVYAYGSAGTTDSLAILAEGGTLVIQGANTIVSGKATNAAADCRSIAIILGGSVNALIQGGGAGNDIRADQATSSVDADYSGVSCGIALSASGSDFAALSVIGPNTISGGISEDVSQGIGISGNVTQVLISGNEIQGGNGGFGGTGTTADPLGSPSVGLAIGESIVNLNPIVIERNLIWGGTRAQAGDLCGLFVADNDFGSPLIIRNNVIHGGGGGSLVGNSCGARFGGSSGSSAYVHLLNNTIYAGGDGAAGNLVGVFLSAASFSSINIINNIIDSEKVPLAIASAATPALPHSLWNNSVHSSDESTYGACVIAGTTRSYADLNSAMVSTDAYGNVIDGTNPRQYITSSAYPTNSAAFFGFNFGLDASALATQLITFGYDGARTIDPGASDGMDMRGQTRTFNWTPGAIERE